MKRDILAEENERLRFMAERDWLTGLYNRCGMEEKINAALKEKKDSSIIVMDIDYFKKINDMHGHIVGDQMLRFVAEILTKMAPKQALIGRVGGDEFVIYMPIAMSDEELKEKCRRIKARFREVRFNDNIQVRLSLTMDFAHSGRHTNYRSFFDEADQKMLARKRVRNEQKLADPEELVSRSAMQCDLKLILSEMVVDDSLDGAYCQEYESFKELFQLELRRMKRDNKKIYLMLLTLTDAHAEFLNLEQRKNRMEYLGQIVRHNLRLGDAFCRYSSSQYLIMVLDVDADKAEIIVDRIKNAYKLHHDDAEMQLLFHQCYPLAEVTVPAKKYDQ